MAVQRVTRRLMMRSRNDESTNMNWPVCWVCGHEGVGYQFCARQSNKTYPACSAEHLDLMVSRSKNGAEPMLTDVEIIAIKMTKAQFADALERQGVLVALNDLTAEQVETIIAETWAALRMHMDVQSVGGVPF